MSYFTLAGAGSNQAVLAGVSYASDSFQVTPSFSGMNQSVLAGPSMRAAILAGLGAISSSSITTGNMCGGAKGVQEALNTLGYGPLVVDGQIGKGSQAAMAKFCADRGIPKASWPNPVFCGALKAALAEREAAATAAPPPQAQSPVDPATVAAQAQAAAAALAAQFGMQVPPVPIPGAQPAVPPGGGGGSLPPPNGAPPPASSEKGLSTAAMVGIGVGGVVLIGGLVWALSGSKESELKANRPRSCGCTYEVPERCRSGIPLRRPRPTSQTKSAKRRKSRRLR